MQATYGITAEQYAALYTLQGGRCAICRRATGRGKRLAVDHNHATGEVRGLLCKPCNRDVLGHLRDDVSAFERAIAYLTDPPALRMLNGSDGHD
nr:endonuclease VII domain-containing protein [Actinocrispum wychmicini]